MKAILGIIIFYFILLFNGHSQNIFIISPGINSSSIKRSYKNLLDGTDSIHIYSSYILPSLQMNYNYQINQKIYLLTGMGVNWIGAKDFNINIPQGYNINTDLKLGFLTIPVGVQYAVIKNKINIFCSYSLNYNFRKNESFYELSADNKLISIYKPFLHTINLGFNFRRNNISLCVSYNYGLSALVDTKDINPNFRTIMEARYMNISLGYCFIDKV